MSDKITPEQEFAILFEKMYELCNNHNWGDPFNYSRGKEIYMANYLKHKVAATLAGPDAFEDDNMKEPTEYKSTIQEQIQATYNGISIQESWEKQIDYLNKEKICKYKNHYYARFSDGKIVELYKMGCEKVMEYLIPRLKKQFEKKNEGKKDPRLGVTIPKGYIVNNSEKLL